MDRWALEPASAASAAYFASGWATTSDESDAGGHRWSVAQTAMLLVPRPPASGARLALTAIPFVVPGLVPYQDVWVFCHGLFTAFGRLAESGSVSGVVPTSVTSGASLEITVVLPDARVPASVGQGNDQRLLGIALQRLELIW